MAFSSEQISNFWSGVKKTNKCWLWQRCVNSSGYGYIKINRRGLSSHRVSFAITHGRMPTGVLRHTCDVRRCVRPSHLIDGSTLENVADMIARGRARFNHSNRPRKLSDRDLIRIHKFARAGQTTRQISRKLKVSQPLIVQVLNGQKAFGRRLRTARRKVA